MIEKSAKQVLRNARNMMLINSDWQMMRSNETNTNVYEWKTYRQALRDLLANSSPELDENGQLINVNWPTPPN